MLSVKKSKRKSIVSIENSPISTVISSDVKIVGGIKGENNIKIDGKVKGDVVIKNGSVILGEKGIIEGNVKCKNALIYGRVIGDITSENMILTEMGSVEGNIDTCTIDIAGIFNGKLSMQKVFSTTAFEESSEESA